MSLPHPMAHELQKFFHLTLNDKAASSLIHIECPQLRTECSRNPEAIYYKVLFSRDATPLSTH